MSDVQVDQTPALSVSDAQLRQIEQFLFEEAHVLDEWRLHEWLELFTPDGHYLIPSTDRPDGDPSQDLFLVQDDRFLLEQRVNSLLTRAAHAEYPHSRTTRMISNVRATHGEADRIHVRANFAVYRVRNGVLDTYVGQYRHVLELDAEQVLRYVERKAVLSLDALRPHGKVSIIL
jgi:p-cumate 2,3-dioxygenase subunit beta